LVSAGAAGVAAAVFAGGAAVVLFGVTPAFPVLSWARLRFGIAAKGRARIDARRSLRMELMVRELRWRGCNMVFASKVKRLMIGVVLRVMRRYLNWG
jgi:hypothetical protein